MANYIDIGNAYLASSCPRSQHIGVCIRGRQPNLLCDPSQILSLSSDV
jgi:hypothetical protein